MTDALLACGATINEMNCLRKHTSAVKGGQLRPLRRARPHSSPSPSATSSAAPSTSSPAAPPSPDISTWADAWAIVDKYGLSKALPQPSYATACRPGSPATSPTPPNCTTRYSPIATHSSSPTTAPPPTPPSQRQPNSATTQSCSRPMSKARPPKSPKFSSAWVAKCSGQRAASVPHPPASSSAAKPPSGLGDNPGQGGRNQELALAASLALQHLPGITVVSLATDGTDGPTDSAGGLADSRHRPQRRARRPFRRRPPPPPRRLSLPARRQ